MAQQQQPQKQLADNLTALAGPSAEAAKTTPISSSDTKPIDDDTQVSTSSSRTTIEANINQQLERLAPSTDKNNGRPSARVREGEQVPASGALDHSVARQQDLEFFRRFLQQSEGAASGAGGSVGELTLGSKLLDQQHARVRGALGDNHAAFAATSAPGSAINKSASSSIIDRLMPQIANHSRMTVAPSYPLPLMYSTFGSDFQSGDTASSLINTLGPNLASASSLAFYGDFGSSPLASATNSNANRIFLPGSDNNTSGLLDSYSSAQLVASDNGLFGNSA